MHPFFCTAKIYLRMHELVLLAIPHSPCSPIKSYGEHCDLRIKVGLHATQALLQL